MEQVTFRPWAETVSAPTLGFDAPVGTQRQVSLSAQLGAAFRLENPETALFDAATREPLPTRVEDGYNVMDHITPAEVQPLSRLLDKIKSPEALEEARKRLAIHQEQERMLQDGPLPGWMAAMGAALLSTSSAVPIGWLARARTARGLVAGGAAAGAFGAAVSELPIYAANPFRTEAESIMNVLVGGAFGAALFGAVGGAAALRMRSSLRPTEARDARLIGYAQDVMHANEEQAAKALARAHDPTAPMVADDVAARIAGHTDGTEVPRGGSIGAAMADDPKFRAVEEEARLERSQLINSKLLEPVYRFLGEWSLTRLPGPTLAVSRFANARAFIHQFADIGLSPEAFRMRPWTADEINRIVEKAQKKGYDIGFEEAARFLEAKSKAGFTMSNRVPLLNAIMDMDRYLFDLQDTRNAAYKALRDAEMAAGTADRSTIEQLDEWAARFIRESDPAAGRLGGNPTPVPPHLQEAVETYAAGVKRITDEFGRRIRSSGIRADQLADMGLEDVLRNEGSFLPKVFDRKAAQLQVGRLHGDLVRHFEDLLAKAEGRVREFETNLETFEKAEGVLKDQRKKLREWADEVDAEAKAALAGDDKNALRQLARDYRRLDKVLGSLLVARLERMGARAAVKRIPGLEEAAGIVDVAKFEAELRATQPHIAAAYSGTFRALREAEDTVAGLTKEANSLRALIDLNAPPTRRPEITLPPVRKPEPYANYEKDKATVKRLGPQESGTLRGTELEASRLADEIVNGPLDRPPTLAGIRGSLRGRELDVDPLVFEPYLQKNLFQTMEQYITTTHRDLSVFEQFGDLKGLGVIEKIRAEALAMRPDLEDALARAKKAGDAKAIAKAEKDLRTLQQELERDTKLVEDLVATARGQKGPHITDHPGLAQFGRNALAVAFMARLGSMIFSQLPDVATATMKYGAARFFGTLAHEIGTGFEGLRHLGSDAQRRLSIATDTAMLTFQRDYSDVSLMAQHGDGRVTRGIQTAARAFAWSTLGPQWNDFIRRIGVLISEDMILAHAQRAAKAHRKALEVRNAAEKAAIDAVEQGQPGALMPDLAELENIYLRALGDNPAGLDQKTRTFMNSAGLEMSDLARIGDLYERFGGMRGADQNGKGLRQSRYLEWASSDAQAAEKFRRAVSYGAWKSLIQPTAADTPMAFQNTVGALVLQFKKFPLASTTRIMAALAQQDSRTVAEVLTVAIGMGAVSIALRDLATKGQIETRKPQEWAVKAVDRSGAMGLLFEIDTTFSHFAGGNSLQKLLSGKDPKFKRGSGQDAVSQTLGPVAGMATHLVDTTAAATRWAVGGERGTSSPPSAQEWRQARGLLPWQNHFLLRHGFDELEAQAKALSGSPVPRAQQRAARQARANLPPPTPPLPPPAP